VIIAKHRNGSLDTVQLKFIGKYTKFADLDGYNNFEGGYNNSFPSAGAPGEFEPKPNTITMGSKLNPASKPPPGKFDEDEEAPF
jgi:replicative DNA helicase